MFLFLFLYLVVRCLVLMQCQRLFEVRSERVAGEHVGGHVTRRIQRTMIMNDTCQFMLFSFLWFCAIAPFPRAL